MSHSDGDAEWEKLVRAAGYAVVAVSHAGEREDGAGLRLTEVKAKLDADNRTSVLLVIKATRGDDSLIAFVGDSSLVGAFITLKKRLKAGGLKWREDRPWSER